MPDDETYDLEDEDPEDDGVLDASDTLEGDPGDDPLDTGIEPPDRWSAGERFGTTLAEERAGESLDQLLAEEEPEPDPYAEGRFRRTPRWPATIRSPGPGGWSPRTRERTRMPRPTWSPATWGSTPAPPAPRKRPSTCRTTSAGVSGARPRGDGTVAAMTESASAPVVYSGRTAWARNLQTPLRQFLRTETGSAAVLLAATVAALAWVNIDAASYRTVWDTRLSVSLGGAGVSQDLGEWINSGLMTFFFLVVGLEARREFDMGELRERRRLALPLLAGAGGMIVPIAIYLLINAGRPSAHGWGTAMSTDTAFALGMLALVGRHLPDRVRTYLLTFSVVDDLVGIAIIAFAYSGQIHVDALLTGLAILGRHWPSCGRRGVRYGPAYALLGVAAWIAIFKSGVDPVLVGLVMGLMTYARPAARGDLERASDLFRLFREQPTPELAQSAREGVRTALSPNDRLQQIYHPLTSYVIVPLFALSNTGVVISGSFLARAFTSPVTLGILVGYVVGKPLGTAGAAWLVTRVSRGRIRPPVGWAAVAGAGAIGGIGFTVSLLIASLAFRGAQLEEARVGVLSAGIVASALTLDRVPAGRTAAQAAARSAPCSARRRSSPTSPCRSTPSATTCAARRSRRSPWSSTETSSARTAARPSRWSASCWPTTATSATSGGTCRSTTCTRTPRPPRRRPRRRPRRAPSGRCTTCCSATRERCGPRTWSATPPASAWTSRGSPTTSTQHAGAAQVAEDVDSADLSGVSGTPTFFINGIRHQGAYDIETLLGRGQGGPGPGRDQGVTGRKAGPAPAHRRHAAAALPRLPGA